MDLDPKQHAMYPVWTSDTIRYADLDPNDHVNNGAMNEYFEDGRVRLRQSHFGHLGKGTLSGFVLARYTVEYYRSLSFPGEVYIGSVVSRVGRTSYTLTQGVFVDEICYAGAEVITVMLDTDTGKPKPFDEPLRAVLERIGPITKNA